MTDVEKAEDDPGADAIRGTLNIRRFSTVRRRDRPSGIDGPEISSPIDLSSRNTWRWNRERTEAARKDGHFGPNQWGAHPGNLRGSTIVEVPPEHEDHRRSSVHFNPNAPVTHIYPPRKSSPEKQAITEENIETIDWGRRGSHNPLSPVNPPDFRSAPPTPRYTVNPKRSTVQKQFSFGRGGGRKNLTEEETMGLVEAGQNEGSYPPESETYVESPQGSPEDSGSESRERYEDSTKRGHRAGRSYDMM